MNWVLFLTMLALTESDGNMNAVGDKHMRDWAYGEMQIRQPYLDDVNRVAGTNFTIQQIAKSRSLSRWCTVTYIKHYGDRYTRLTGKPLTMEIAARIHNGGPNGWKRDSTDAHWQRFLGKLSQEGYIYERSGEVREIPSAQR